MNNLDIKLSPLYKFISFILIFLVVCIVGISNVFAAEYNLSYSDLQVYYDNRGTSVLSVGQTWNESLQSYVSNSITTVASSYGGGVSFNSPIPIIKNHNYSISIAFTERNNIAVSSKNKIAIGSSTANASSNYSNNDFKVTQNYGKVTNRSVISFNFTANENYNYIFIPWTTTTNTTQTYNLTKIIMEDLGSEGISEEVINNSINSQTTILQNGLNDLEDNINSSINDMGKNISNTINDNFTSCHSSKNLFDFANSTLSTISNTYIQSSSILSNGYQVKGQENNLNTLIDYRNGQIWVNGTLDSSLTSEDKLTFVADVEIISNPLNADRFSIYINNQYSGNFVFSSNNFKIISSTPNNINLNENQLFVIRIAGTEVKLTNIMILKGLYTEENIPSFHTYNEQFCTNKIDDTNSKLDEAEKTRKSIWQTLRDLPSAFLDMLLSLFVPDNDFFSEWWEDFSTFFDNKLGFLTTPIEIFINFISLYLDISSETDIIINIPNITVPNFDNFTIISSQSFNWTELLNSKQSLLNLWNLYLDFIDVFLILNFIGLCENAYSRIFGGDTSNYEYYTVEDSYTYDVGTGEVKSARRNERKTQRKKVD